MHVKRHLSRLFGSFRRKDEKNLGQKVYDQVQSREKQTASRWELLDQGDEDNHRQEQSFAEPKNTINLSLQRKKTGSFSTPTFQEVRVELSRQNSTRLSFRRGFKKFSNSIPEAESEHPKLPQQQSIPSNHNLQSSSSSSNCSPNVASVVQEINDTINLINDFKLVSENDSLNPSFQVQNKPDVIDVFDTKFQFSDNNNGIVSMSELQNATRSNPDTISSAEQVSRLTSTIWTESAQKKIINMSQNEERRATSLFASDETSPGTCESGRSRSFQNSSRPWAEEMRKEKTNHRSSSMLRNSGRKLYKTIHNRLNKKSTSLKEKENFETSRGKDCFEDTFCSETFSPLNTTKTNAWNMASHSTNREGNKENEIKSIGPIHCEDAKKGNPSQKLTRSKSGRLTRSFRRAISFPLSSFTPLDNYDNKDNNGTRDEIKRNGIWYSAADKDETEMEYRETGQGKDQPDAMEGGWVKAKRKLSMRALRPSGSGMKRILRKGASAFGKSMIHASAMMPAGGYECPELNNYPEAYWDDEDYFYKFRRYCQSTEKDNKGQAAN